MWFEILLITIIFCVLAYLDTKKPKKYPPGPKWLPIIGSSLTVYNQKKHHQHFFKVTAEMSKEYGPIIGLKTGKDLIVVVLGAQEIREFLASDDLSGRPKGLFYEVRTWGKRRGLLCTDAEFWKEQRKFVLRHLREFGFGRKDMSCMIEDEAETMINSIRKSMKNNNGTAVVDMTGLFNVHVLNTLWTMLAGVKYDADSDDCTLRKLQKILAQLLDNSHMVGILFSHYPILRYLAPELSGYNLYVNSHKPLWEFLKEEVRKHRETYNSHTQRDFMDVYLQMILSPEKPPSFSEEQLLAICLDFFIAGSETTSKALGFGFFYLLKTPEVQRKVQEEMDRVVGKERQLSLHDRPNMPYTEATVLESLRMFMGRAHGVPHRALRDTELCGYYIPKDTMVIVNYHNSMIGTDFQDCDPDAFRPERFLKDGKLCPFSMDKFLPFGFGKRRCMGETLARANLFLFIGTLLQYFSFKPADNHLEMNVIDGVTPGLAPYRAEIRARDE